MCHDVAFAVFLQLHDNVLCVIRIGKQETSEIINNHAPVSLPPGTERGEIALALQVCTLQSFLIRFLKCRFWYA